ncbi:hypothetical protein GGD40_000564 [Paraburkholderia bryophila]|uniref:Uncharacterized protein n=1 Tax=Paraburkholderia bryophila TaxID=420952 RepID=A0A7Y9WHQ3_9BURK|nr:hypothetical protein [Paraburkholderia bryophila]
MLTTINPTRAIRARRCALAILVRAIISIAQFITG